MVPARSWEGARTVPGRGGRRADGGSSRAAAGTGPRSPRLGPRRNERESKTRARPGAVRPSGFAGAGAIVCGRVGVKPREAGGGSRGGRGDPAARGTGNRRPGRTAGVTEERRPRGAPLGNKLHDHSSERRKKSPCCSPGGRGRPARANPALEPGRPGGRRPAPPPPPPPRLGVSLL